MSFPLVVCYTQRPSRDIPGARVSHAGDPITNRTLCGCKYDDEKAPLTGEEEVDCKTCNKALRVRRRQQELFGARP